MTSTTTVFPAEGAVARGAVIVAPGLNNRPEAMEPLIDVLTRNAYDCVRTSLRFGQRGRSDAIARTWLGGVADAHRVAATRAGGRPVCAVAYSLGAAVTLAFLQGNAGAKLARMFLVAPALALTTPASLIRALTPLRVFGLALPSLAPKETRARSSTTFADYHAMLSLVGELDRAEIAANIRQADTRVIVTDRDELVDADGVRDWVARHRLDWPVKVLDSAPPRTMPHHLLLSETTMGAKAWRVLTRELLDHLSGQRPVG